MTSAAAPEVPDAEAFVRRPEEVQAWVRAHPDAALALDVDATTFPYPGARSVTLRTLLDMFDPRRPHFLTYAALPSGANALFVAVSSGSPQELKEGLASGTCSLEWVFDGRVGTALAHSARMGAAWAVTRLLEAGANPHYVAPHGETLFGAAAVGGSPDVIRLLATRLSAAAANGYALMSPRVSETPLVAALHRLHGPEVVEALLAAGADPNLNCDGRPAAGIVLQSIVGGLSPADALVARLLARVLMSNNRTDLDRVWPALGGSVRAYAAAHKIHVQ